MCGFLCQVYLFIDLPSLFQKLHCWISLSLAHPLALSPDTPYVGQHNFVASHSCNYFAYMKCGMYRACFLVRSILFSRVGFAWLFLLITMKDLHGARCVLCADTHPASCSPALYLEQERHMQWSIDRGNQKLLPDSQDVG